jgi:hypothetical protein
MNFSKKNPVLKKTEMLLVSKTLKATLLIVFFLMLLPSVIRAQDSNNSQAYWVHEDPVYPSMVAEYEKISKELVENCNKYNIQETSWITSMTDDFRYLYLTPVDNMADLDKNGFATLQEKMGKDAFNNLFNSFNNCYEKHFDYILNLDKGLSYMPNGITQTPEGQPYRRFIYYYVTPENYKKFTEKGKEIKDLFVKKGSKVYYRIYRSGFGAPGNFVMVAIAAKSAEDFEKISMENQELLGDEGKNLFEAILKYTSKYESISGWIRPDLAYQPK